MCVCPYMISSCVLTVCVCVCLFSLIQKIVGKTRDVRNETAGKDTSYYQSLLKAKHTVSH